jgi:hypothetical protein
MATVWTIPLDITSRWFDSVAVRSFLVSNDLPDASADPQVRTQQFFGVTKSLEANMGRTFHTVQEAASALFDGVEGGVPVALKLAASRLILKEVYQTRLAPAPLPDRVVKELGQYSYALVDPRSRTVFHVGAGVGNQIFALTWEALKQDDSLALTSPIEVSDAARAQLFTIVRDIYDSGLAVEHWVLDHEGDADRPETVPGSEALAAGRALTLVQRPDLRPVGAGAPTLVDDLALRYSAEPAPEIPIPSLILEVPAAAAHGVTPDQILAAASGPWDAGQAVRSSESLPVFVLADDIVRAVYRVTGWHMVSRTPNGALWRFSAEPDAELGAAFTGTRVTPHRVGLKKWPASGWISRLTRALPGR